MFPEIDATIGKKQKQKIPSSIFVRIVISENQVSMTRIFRIFYFVIYSNEVNFMMGIRPNVVEKSAYNEKLCI